MFGNSWDDLSGLFREKVGGAGTGEVHLFPAMLGVEFFLGGKVGSFFLAG